MAPNYLKDQKQLLVIGTPHTGVGLKQHFTWMLRRSLLVPWIMGITTSCLQLSVSLTGHLRRPQGMGSQVVLSR